MDTSSEKIGYKIRKAQMEKVPYMAIVGDKEMAAGTISVRERTQGDIGVKAAEEVLHMIKQLADSRQG